MHSTTSWSPRERQDHHLLQSGLDLLDQGLTVFDAELQLVAWNAAFLRLLDFPPELVFVGASFESFMRYNAERGEYGPGDIEELVRVRVEAARAFEVHNTERHRPGGQIIAVRGGPLPDKGFVALYTDITAQRRYERRALEHQLELEERVSARTRELQASNERLSAASDSNRAIATALRLSEERLRLITDSVPALIGYFDRDQIYRYANQRYAEWFDHGKSGIVGRSIEQVVGEKIYLDVLPYIARAVRGEQVSYQYAMERADGPTVHARSTIVPEFDADGAVLGCFVLSIDISELTSAQAALLEAQKMEAVGQLTGGLAHDFNNLLTVVIGNLAALMEHDPLPATAQCVTPALNAAKRGAALIKRLLAFARQQPLTPCPVDVGELVAATCALLRHSVPDNVAVAITQSAPQAFALTDPHQLENALLNLAFNGRDAMPGGGTLRIDIAPRTVGEQEGRALDMLPGYYMQISVSDNGAGMSQKTLARAFEPFFTTKRFGAGNGLGLSMVYGFAKQSEGGVSIHSAAGQGTTVRLLLPRCAAPPAAAPAPEEAAADPARHKALVLLVEDDADVRMLIRGQLMQLGYPVLEAGDGADAIAILDSVPDIGVVISDIALPGRLSGRQIVRSVRASYPHIALLLISGYPHEASAHEACDGDPPVLQKPFSRLMLRRALAERMA